MGFNFKAHAGKTGIPANWIGEVKYLGPNRYGIVYEKDQATCRPESVLEKGSSFAVSDPRVNAHGKHDWAVVSENQLKEICDKGTYCQKPGIARGGRSVKSGDTIGILCVRGTLTKGSSSEWRVDEATADLPIGYPNVPGISTVTGQKTAQPRFNAFKKRLNANHEVANAMNKFEKKQKAAAAAIQNAEPEERVKVAPLDVTADVDMEMSF